MSNFIKLCLSLCLGLSMGSAPVSGSGTYPPAPPRLRSDITAEIDPTAYNKGKLIFAGKATFEGSSINPDQSRINREMLEDVANRIPERARDQIDVATLAIKLNEAENDALLYYLRLRFRLSEVTS